MLCEANFLKYSDKYRNIYQVTQMKRKVYV